MKICIRSLIWILGFFLLALSTAYSQGTVYQITDSGLIKQVYSRDHLESTRHFSHVFLVDEVSVYSQNNGYRGRVKQDDHLLKTKFASSVAKYHHAEINGEKKGTYTKTEVENESGLFGEKKSRSHTEITENTTKDRYVSTYKKSKATTKKGVGITSTKKKREYDKTINFGEQKDYRTGTFYTDENGVLYNGYGVKASETEVSAYNKHRDPQKGGIGGKLKESTALKIREDTFWDEGKGLYGFDENKGKVTHENFLGKDGDLTTQVQLLGVASKSGYQLDCTVKGCGGDINVKAEAILVKVGSEYETKFLEDTPFVPAIESTTQVKGEVVAEGEAKGAAYIGLEGAKLEGKAGAFAGAKAEGSQSFGTSFLGLGLKTKFKGELHAGAGAEATGTFEVSSSRIKIGGKVAASLGLGGGTGMDIEIDISKWTSFIAIFPGRKDKTAPGVYLIRNRDVDLKKIPNTSGVLLPSVALPDTETNGTWVNPNKDWVNPNKDWVNPNKDWKNPKKDWKSKY